MSCLAMNSYSVAGSTAASRNDRFPLREGDLVADARRGHSDAFEELCRRYAEQVFRMTQRITGNHEDAEDAIQIKDFDGRSRFSTWLTRMAINSALMSLRKKRSSPMVSPRTLDESERNHEV